MQLSKWAKKYGEGPGGRFPQHSGYTPTTVAFADSPFDNALTLYEKREWFQRNKL